MRAPSIAWTPVAAVSGCAGRELPPAGGTRHADAGLSDFGPRDTSNDDPGQDAGRTDSAALDASAPDAGAGPSVLIHIRATATPFAHADQPSGQTPRDHRNGIRRFDLLQTAQDPAPPLRASIARKRTSRTPIA